MALDSFVGWTMVGLAGLIAIVVMLAVHIDILWKKVGRLEKHEKEAFPNKVWRL